MSRNNPFVNEVRSRSAGGSENPFVEQIAKQRRVQERTQENPFVERIRRQKEFQSELDDLNSTAHAAVEHSGDELAAAQQASDMTGVSVSQAQQDMAEARRQIRLREMDEQLRRSPLLRSYFRNNPVALGIAQDDLDVLAEIGEFAEELAFVPSTAAAGIGAGVTNVLAAGLRRIPQEQLRELGVGLEPIAANLTDVQRTLRGDRANLSGTENAILSGIESTLQTAPLILSALVTGGGTLPALAGGAALAGGQARGEALAEGATEARATLAGLAEGTLEAVWEKVPLGFLAEDVLGNASFRRLLFRQFASEGITEQGATFTQDLAQQVILDPDKPLGEFFNLEERGSAAYQTFVATLVGVSLQSGGIGLATSGGGGQPNAPQQAAQSAEQSLNKLSELLKGSSTRERAPQIIQQFLANNKSELRIDAATLVETLEAQGLDLDDVRQKVPSINEQIDDALTLGGEVTIPLSEWAANMAAEEYGQALNSHFRVNGNEMSAAEAGQQAEVTPEQQAADAQASLSTVANIAEQQAQVAEIESAIATQLTAARPDLYAAEDAAASAAVIGAFYQQASEKLGIAPEELFKQFPVRVTGGEQATMTELTQPLPEASVIQEFNVQAGRGNIVPINAAVNAERGAEIARLYDTTPSAPDSPEVRAQYEAFISETQEQFEYLKAQGYTFEFTEDEAAISAAYPTAQAMREDLRQNKHLLVWTGGLPQHGLLDQEQNAIFRAVHDTVAHGLFDNPFGHLGEEGAWAIHSQMYSDAAVGAMTTETRGQNNALHFSEQLGNDQTRLTEDITDAGFRFPEQKALLLPKQYWRPELPAQTELQQTVFHGTGAQFAEFDLGRVQSANFGFGVYFTSSKEIADFYKQAAQFAGQEGAVLEAEIPEANEFLQWNLPLSEQSPHVREALAADPTVEELAANAALGQNLYEALAARLGSEKAASDRLSAIGVQGVQYPEDPTGQSNAQNFVVFDPRAVQIAEFAQGERGAIRFDPEQGAVIRLTQAADATTFLHEAGHLFLEVYTQVATRPGVNQQIADDVGELMKWFNVESVEAFRALTTEQRREHHEKFAEGFETYLFRGQAPNEALRPLFRRFKSWLKAVYKALSNMRVTLNPEVIGVMDRMLAASDKVSITEAQRLAKPMFESRDQAGLTEQEWDEYQALNLDATENAQETLERRSIRDMKWLRNARGRELKKLQKEARAKREAMRERATREVQNRPERLAEDFLKTGTFNYEGKARLMEVHKLDRGALQEMYAALEGTDAPVPNWQNLKSGRTNLTAENGLHPDDVARMAGFPTGDELVRALDGLAPIKDDIEAHLDHLMLQEHGDLSTPEAIERAADIAIHNDARIKMAALELKALGSAVKIPDLIRAAKIYTADAIGRKKVGKLRRQDFELAETRAAKQSLDALAKGDLVLAAMHKRNQILNMMASKRASQVIEQLGKDRDYLKKFRKKALRDTIGRDTVEQVDGLLEKYGFREPTDTERPTLQSWLDEQTGFAAAAPDWVLNGKPRPYDQLTVDQFGELMDAIKSVEAIGRNRQKLLTAQKAISLQQAAESLSTTTRATARKTVPQGVSRATGAIQKAKGLLLMNRYFDSVAREFDGWTEGAWWDTLVRTKNEAADFKSARMKTAANQLQALFKQLGGSMATPTHVKAINMTLTRGERIAVALNTGNRENLQRLQDGGIYSGPTKLNPDQIRAVLDSLTKEEMDFVQGVWDYFDSFWPEVAAKEKRLKGFAPKQVQATPVVTRHGTYRGGYYPIKYDPRASRRSDQFATEEAIMERMLSGQFAGSSTRHAHVKERKAEVKNVQLDLSLDHIASHTQEIIHDLAFNEWVVDAHRLLHHDAVTGAIREHYGDQVLSQLRHDVRTYAIGEMNATKAIDKFARVLRKHTGVATLAYSVTTGLVQPLGLLQAIPRLGSKNGKLSTTRGIAWLAAGAAKNVGSIVTMNRAAHYIRERSPFMAERSDTFIRVLSEVRDDFSNSSRGKKLIKTVHQRLAVDAGFAHIRVMQGVADNIIWLAAEAKAASEGKDPDTAARIADQAVRDTQGSGLLTDRTALENHATGQLFTMYWTFFSRTYATMKEVRGQTRSITHLPAAAASFAAIAIMPAIISQLLFAATRADEPEEELDPEDFLTEIVSYQLNMIPFFGREIAGAVQGFDYRGPAAFRFFAESSRLYEQTLQGELDETWWRAFIATTGIGFALPGAQFDRSARGVLEYLDSGDNPEQVLFGPKLESR